MRIAIFWSELSGYVNACLKELVATHGNELLVCRITKRGPGKRPYDDKLFSWMPKLITLPDGSAKHKDQLSKEASEFQPDVAIVSGWAFPVYRQVARDLKRKGVYVIGTCDNPWLGTLKQQFGALISPWYLHSMFDVMWVPGERATQFARNLGFTGSQLMSGLYSSDSSTLYPVGQWRVANNIVRPWPRRFLFTGRLDEEKGVHDLLQAYHIYRDSVGDPWELRLLGSGPLQELVDRTPNIDHPGFIQPWEYPETLKEAGTFILPSYYDPWPLVIHESTSAALPILCSRQCGSSVELVQDGYNGFLFEAGDISGLANLMRNISHGNVDLPLFSQRSFALAQRYSTVQWANYLMEWLQERK